MSLMEWLRLVGGCVARVTLGRALAPWLALAVLGCATEPVALRGRPAPLSS
ncbi:MAG: hypothetical protein ACREM3_05675 [Candidatus Rokuibacteriota bacterium]